MKSGMTVEVFVRPSVVAVSGLAMLFMEERFRLCVEAVEFIRSILLLLLQAHLQNRQQIEEL